MLDSNIGLAFYNGGPRALVWGFFIVIPGILCQVASVSELASVQPIAGVRPPVRETEEAVKTNQVEWEGAISLDVASRAA